MTTLDKIQIRKYMTKYDYLETELLETKMLFEEYNRKFLEEFYTQEELKAYKETKVGQSEQSIREDELNAEPVDTNEMVRSLYRKLSLRTHPDKVPERAEMFKRLQDAYKRKDIIDMIRIAETLDIVVDISVAELLPIFDESIRGIENAINELKQTLAWHWVHATEEEKEIYKQRHKVV
ncbi:hypothetical protein EB118_11915 [bacterium]|nr:hypothetical protein [bacterium]NDD83622.1 hypothetical protein [bacterium]NDG30766.1 hypothetical protein [bacterium]